MSDEYESYDDGEQDSLEAWQDDRLAREANELHDKQMRKMVPRSEAEILADQIMIELSGPYTHPLIRDHVYELHRLRDAVMWDEFNDFMEDVLDYSRHQKDEFWFKAQPMQTHYRG